MIFLIAPTTKRSDAPQVAEVFLEGPIRRIFAANNRLDLRNEIESLIDS